MTLRFARSMSVGVFVLASFVISPTGYAQGSWTVSGNMSVTRLFAQTSPLLDGRVLITGGALMTAQFYGTRTVDLHDPATGTTTSGQLMNYARLHHGAVRLPDGRVMIIGGLDETLSYLASVEIFDPATNAWSLATPMNLAKAQPQSVVLPDGRVLVAGASFVGNVATSLVEIYNPAANTWAPVSPEDQKVYGGATMMADGRVMLTFGGSIAQSEFYDPESNTWSPATPMVNPIVAIEQLIRIPDNRIVTVGLAGVVQVYDPATGVWTAGAQAPLFQRYPGVGLLADGRLLVAGGLGLIPPSDQTITQIYDPVTNSWSAGPSMNQPHTPRLAHLPDGRIVAAGSFFGPNGGSRAIEILAPPNRPPTSDAGADVTGATCDACVALVEVDGSGSSDPDGDPLTYTWSIGATVLASSPSPTAQLQLPAGVTTLTLTVSDEDGLEDSDTVDVTMINVEDAYRAQVSSLQNSVNTLTLALATCEAGASASQQAVNSLEAFFRSRFDMPGFELPGAATQEQLDNLVNAIKQLNRGQQQALFKNLGGR